MRSRILLRRPAHKDRKRRLSSLEKEDRGLPKTNQTTKKLLEGDVKERPAATVGQRRCFLQSVMGKTSSESTVLRLLKKKMGFTRSRSGGARPPPRGEVEPPGAGDQDPPGYSMVPAETR